MKIIDMRDMMIRLILMRVKVVIVVFGALCVVYSALIFTQSGYIAGKTFDISRKILMMLLWIKEEVWAIA